MSIQRVRFVESDMPTQSIARNGLRPIFVTEALPHNGIKVGRDHSVILLKEWYDAPHLNVV